MTLKDYQRIVDEWARQFERPYWNPLSQYTRLVEEVGELGRELNDRYGDKPKKPTEQKKEVGDEIGDILFTLICIANREGISLDEAFGRVMEKYKTRDKNRHKKKE